jgi:hypothetical protein
MTDKLPYFPGNNVPNPDSPKPTENGGAKEASGLLAELQKAMSIPDAHRIMEQLAYKDPTLRREFDTKKRRYLYRPDNHPAAIEFKCTIRRIKGAGTAETGILNAREKNTVATKSKIATILQAPTPEPAENTDRKITRDISAELQKAQTLAEAIEIMRVLVEDKIVRIDGGGNYKLVGPHNTEAAKIAHQFYIIKQNFQRRGRGKSQAANTTETSNGIRAIPVGTKSKTENATGTVVPMTSPQKESLATETQKETNNPETTVRDIRVKTTSTILDKKNEPKAGISTEKPKAPAAKPAEAATPHPLIEKEQAFSKLIKENLEKHPQLKLINCLIHASRTKSPTAAYPALSLEDIDRLLIASLNWSDKTPPKGLRDLAKKGIEPNLEFLLKVANTLQEEIRKLVPAEKPAEAKEATQPQTPDSESNRSEDAMEPKDLLPNLEKAETMEDAKAIMEIAVSQGIPTIDKKGFSQESGKDPKSEAAPIEAYPKAEIRIKEAERMDKPSRAPETNAPSIREPIKSVTGKPAETSKPKPVAPLSITLSDGNTYADRKEFTEFYQKLKRINDKVADALSNEYSKRMLERIVQIKKEADTLTQEIPNVSRIILEQAKDGPSAIRDMVKPFVEKGYLNLNNEKIYESAVAGTEDLVKAINKRIQDLELAKIIRLDSLNGFIEITPDTAFVYLIEVDTDEKSGLRKITVSNVIPYYGKPTVGEDVYFIGPKNPPPIIQDAMKTLKIRIEGKKNDEQKFDYKNIWTRIIQEKDRVRAIQEADILLDRALREMGNPGCFYDRLLRVHDLPRAFFKQIMDAHKLRNEIAHNSFSKVDEETYRSAMRAFEKALRHLKVIS